MRFLIPAGGKINPKFGVLTAPNHKGIPQGIKAGLIWAADLGCASGPAYVKRFDPDKTIDWLNQMVSYSDNCIFVTKPDHIGNAKATIEEFYKWNFGKWPVAFVAQDGQEDCDFPPSHLWQALFIGGTTNWKLSACVPFIIQRARALGKHIHIGRVNRFRRYQYFASLDGSEEFTCDGTRIRFERNKAESDWLEYMETPKQFNLFVPYGDHPGKPTSG